MVEATAELDLFMAIQRNLDDVEARIGAETLAQYRRSGREHRVAILEDLIAAGKGGTGNTATIDPEATRFLECARKAAWKIAVRYRRLAVREARKVGRASHREDLIQEALMGLHAAALRFDPNRGDFPRFARWWARAYCTRYACSKGRHLPVPGGWVEQKRNLGTVLEAARNSGIHLTDEAIREALNISAQRLAVLRLSYQTDSLSEPLFSDGDPTTLGDLLPDPGPLPDHDGREDLARAQAALSRLTPRQQRILRAYFFDDRTLVEIGEEFGVCKERIRQGRNQALATIREELGIVVVECAQARCHQPAAIGGFCGYHLPRQFLAHRAA